MSSWVCPTTIWWWDTPLKNLPWTIMQAHFPVNEFRSSFGVLSPWTHNLKLAYVWTNVFFGFSPDWQTIGILNSRHTMLRLKLCWELPVERPHLCPGFVDGFHHLCQVGYEQAYVLNMGWSWCNSRFSTVELHILSSNSILQPFLHRKDTYRCRSRELCIQ